MRRILPTVICCFFLFQTAIQAQLATGNIILDPIGSYALNSVQGNPDRSIVTSTQLGASYFINDNFAVGGKIAIASFENDINLDIGSNIRYYLSIKEKSAWFLENNLNLNGIGGFLTFGGDFGVGLDYFVNSSFALETKLSAGWDKRNGFSNNQKLFTLGTGFKFFLNRNEETEITNGIIRRKSILIGLSSSSLQFITTDGTNPNVAGNLFNVSLTPSLAKMLTDQFAVGGQIGFLFQKSTSSDISYLSMDITPYARFYPNPIRKDRRFFFEGGAGLNITQLKNGFFGRDYSNTAPIFFGGIGLNLFLAPSVALEFKGSYRRAEQFGNKINRLGIDVGFQFFINQEEDGK